MVGELLDDVATCIGFFSRLPWPRRAGAIAPFARAVRLLPLASLIIAAPAGLALWLATAAGLSALIAAALAMAALVLTTGALHEDGLADCADGFGGGSSREAKLLIMKDSRIGTYGVVALALTLLLRVLLLSSLLTRGPTAAVAALLATAAVSRTACLLPLSLLPPARPDGLGAGVGRPALGLTVFLAAVLAAVLLLAAGFSTVSFVLAIALAAAAALAVTALARRMIGGQTGDVAGAAQQLSEIAFMLPLLTGQP